jgi:beta-glucosidase
MSDNRFNFPPDFTWGVATAAYQVEGAGSEDGRSPSIWDTFAATPGKIADGSSGAVACDQYHLYPQDVQLIKSLGAQAYRFSIAWPRILPDADGRVNEKGLDYYDRLIDNLLETGIEPYATLYHWDMPQSQFDKAGWDNRGVVDGFLNYVDVVTRAFSDRVNNWITLNEPWCISFLSYALGEHAPGWHDLNAALRASHYLNVAHGKAVPLIRANGNANTRVGIVLNLAWNDPATDTPEDRAAAAIGDGFGNRWFLDPIFKGRYPADMLALFGEENVPIEPGDLEAASAPIDFLGVNYYNRNVVAAGGPPPFGNHLVKPEGSEYTAMGWEVSPEGLYKLLVKLKDEYAPRAMYITENGAAFDDQLVNGEVHDPRRVAYLQEHFAAANRAIAEGVPLKGYFVWSLLDNFEWAFGYTRRFGIVYTDYATQQRIVKDSGKWYSQLIRQNALNPQP